MYCWVLVVMLAGCQRESAHRGPETQPADTANLVRTATRGPVKLTVEVDRAEVTVPDPLTLTVTVEAEVGVEITMPDLGEDIGAFTVQNTTESEPSGDAMTRRVQRVYRLVSVIPGNQSIPSISIAFTDRRERADGSPASYEDTVATEPIPITIRQVLADVKGPVSLPMSISSKLLLWGIGAVVAMVVAAMFARWWRRRRTAARAQARKTSVAAHDWALAELDMLAAEGLVDRGLVQEFFYRVNGLLRRYIEMRFGLMAAEQTSEEFMRALQHSGRLDEKHKAVLRRFIRACDPVKYARQQPDPSEIDWVFAAARDFVLETAETPAERADESPASAQEPPALAGVDLPADSPTSTQEGSSVVSSSQEGVG